MPNINLPGSGHVSHVAISGWQWLPVSNHSFEHTLRTAFRIIDARIKGYALCNQAFSALPGHRSFAQIWNDANIWINFDPVGTYGRYGATIGNDIAISAYALRMGHWTTAATLIHELAHVDGAPGTNTQAEDTLLSCMLAAHHDSRIIGQIMNNPHRLTGVSAVRLA